MASEFQFQVYDIDSRRRHSTIESRYSSDDFDLEFRQNEIHWMVCTFDLLGNQRIVDICLHLRQIDLNI